MADPGTRATDKATATVENRLVKTYRQAHKELQQTLKDFEDKFADKQRVMSQKLQDGDITEKEYRQWMQGQVFQSKIWKQKVDQAAAVLADANRQALRIVNDEKMNVFAENANYQAYQLSHDTGMDLSFSLYDKDTVGKLIRERPELMPRKQLNGQKDRAWNKTKIANAVSQGIIQGESIPEIAKRIARDTASENGSAMTRYARTAMTSAQNAGRMETMERAKGMGIKCRKKWLATLDKRTRDAHADLDGQVVDVDEPFHSILGDIMYPGDPSADPANVWNCRCTMVYVYDEYENDLDLDERRDNESGDVIKNISYKEWLATKERMQAFTMPKIGLSENMEIGLSEMLAKLPEEKAKRYASGIQQAPKVISNKLPNGKIADVSCYLPPPNDKIYYVPKDTSWWIPVHETTHYRDAHTTVTEKVKGGERIYKTVSDWMNSKYTPDKRKQDIESLWKFFGTSVDADLSDKYVGYYVWRKKAIASGCSFDDLTHLNDLIDGLIKKELPIDSWGAHANKNYWDKQIVLLREGVSHYSTMDVIQNELLMESWSKMMPNLFDILREGNKKIWITN